MEKLSFQASNGQYQVYRDVRDPSWPYAVFFHGGPGYNTWVERVQLGGQLGANTNFLWFDLIGCGETRAKSPENIRWDSQVEDAAEIIREFAGGPVHVFGHCVGAQVVHTFARKFPEMLRSAVLISPCEMPGTAFKNILRLAQTQGRLPDLSLEDQQTLARLLSVTELDFGQAEFDAFVQFVVKVRDLAELYWTNRTAMVAYGTEGANFPFSFDAFLRLQADFFRQPRADYSVYQDVPLLIVEGTDDQITPATESGDLIAAALPHAKRFTVSGVAHWPHFESGSVTSAISGYLGGQRTAAQPLAEGFMRPSSASPFGHVAASTSV